MNLVSCLPILPLLAVGAVQVSAQAPPRPAHRSPLRIVAHAAGGALLGSWAGFVTSQVAWSDWRDGAGRRAQRIRFSVTGAALGLLAGTLMGTRSNKDGPAPVRRPKVQRPIAAGPITADEIRASAARSVSELLRALRPLWLRSRGEDVLRPNSDPLAAHGVRVYLNGGLLGGLDALDQVSIYSIMGVQFFDAAAAILRWGAGNDDGAILLTTALAP